MKGGRSTSAELEFGPLSVSGGQRIVERVCGYIVAITQVSTGGIYGIPARNALNCRTLKALWKEVDDYWMAKSILTHKSRFAE